MIRRPLVVAVLALATLFLAACGSSGSSTTNVKTSTTTTSPTQTTKAADRQPNSKLSKVQITTLQGRLATVGCFGVTPDGVLGPLTRAAIVGFQAGAGLTADGQYETKTKAKLTADAAAKTVVCKAATTTSTTAAATAPCTSAAILAAVQATGDGPVTITDFGCDGSWAWAGVDVSTGTDGYEATKLLQANGDSWAVADRATNCVAGKIPADVYTPGCTTN